MYNQRFEDLEGELELVEIPQGRVVSKCDITISKAKTQLDIHTNVGRLLTWPDVVRLNLYTIGKTTFVLKPHKVGILTAKRIKTGGYRISSKNFCMTLMARTEHCRTYEAWVEDDVLMFRPLEVEE